MALFFFGEQGRARNCRLLKACNSQIETLVVNPLNVVALLPSTLIYGVKRGVSLRYKNVTGEAMKAWLLPLLIVGLVGTATARDSASQDDASEMCAIRSRVAGIIMDRRQAGAQMFDLVEGFKEDVSKVAMVMAAYEVPRYVEDKERAQASRDFERDYYQYCIEKLMRSERGGAVRRTD